MKLRIRVAGGDSSSTTLRVEVPAACSLQDLQDTIVGALQCRGIPFSQPIQISLNKTDPIHGHASAMLSELGIRSGDLLYYFNAGVSHATAGRPQSDLASKDAASIRRELCAAAASQRALSLVHTSTSTAAIDAKNTEVCTSGKPVNLADEAIASWDASHVSTDMQTDGEKMSQDDLFEGADAAQDDLFEGADAVAARASNSIPAILQRILIAEHGHVRRASDLLVLAVHAVMLETGFVVVDGMKEGYSLLRGWSNGGNANIYYTLREIQNSGHNVGNVVLKSLTLGNNVVVYGNLTGGTSQPRKLSMLASKHLNGNTVSQDDLLGSFSDLFELWKCAKDELSLPLLAAMCEMAGLPTPSSFLVIPTELKMKILECLPALELVKAGSTCSELRHLSANDELWKKLFLEEFGSLSAAQKLPNFRGWKSAYAVRFLERKRVLERRSQPRRPTHGLSIRFTPRFPQRRGIIGGDYDIYPFGSGPFRGGGSWGGAGGPPGCLHGSLREENMPHMW